MPVSSILLNNVTYKGHSKSIVFLLYSFTIQSIPAALLFLNLLTHFLISTSVIGASRVVLSLIVSSAHCVCFKHIYISLTHSLT